MKNFRVVIAAVTAFTALSSCYNVFTTSVFEDVPVDMAAMTDAQAVSYAEDLLATGDADQLAEAYGEIAGIITEQGIDLSSTELTDEQIELVELAANLAVGSSGIGDAITGALDTFANMNEETNIEEEVNNILESLDTTNLDSAVGYFETIIANADPESEEPPLTDEQYLNAAAAQLLVVIDDAGGVDNLGAVDPEDPDLAQALDWAIAGGGDLSSMLGGLAIPE